ncbi:hypothetical protein HPP92_009565 [Vanilla planifolia]|uniref:URB1 N-terminal domain-containing protein n=1 Tax=Vanilla planifolia TaxID=51239 RepID=A0A835V733_VANPL|nr:hypothetical protein HPP92_009565 [Vanilla planifolia]
MSFILSLFSVILGHPEGKSRPVSVRRLLDGLARSVIEDKLDDIYVELKSQDTRRQSAALFLLASIVKRGMGLASEVAKRFDFKLPVLSKLSKLFRVQKVKKAGNGCNHGRKRSSRKAFVEFAISFVEVGNPRLLRWILQQKEMFSGVLRGLANDDADTVITVLTTLHNRVLREDSLVPPGLRSVLFGSATLEQLSLISGNPMAGPVADIAHDVLLMVCTDPQNGLMPGAGLKGNQKWLLDLMRKLKPNKVAHHKHLLLAIVKGRPNLCSVYMDEFPYNLEPNASTSWLVDCYIFLRELMLVYNNLHQNIAAGFAISLVTDIISTVDVDAAVATIFAHSSDESIARTKELHGQLKCIIPRAFTRPVINKGLLHSNILVKHGTLRLVLESLKLLNDLLTSMETLIKDSVAKQGAVSFEEGMVNLQNPPGLNSLTHLDMHSIVDRVDLSPDKARTEELRALKIYVESEIRAELPDPQVFLKLLISSSAKHSVIGVKRPANFPDVALKKSKTDKSSESMDILISGLDMLPADVINEDAKNANAVTSTDEKKDEMTVVYDIWELTEDTSFGNKSKDVDNFFRSKVFDVLKFSLRTMPIAFEGSFDFFKILPDNPADLSIDHQLSLLSLLFEYVKHSAGSRASAGAIEAMYRHLHPLINFLICSQVKDIHDQAYTLVRMAMISTGAFDQNISEIDAWFEFLPGYIKDDNLVQGNGIEALRSHFAVVISFLCDAVSTIGNNLYSYLNQMHQFLLDADFNNGKCENAG